MLGQSLTYHGNGRGRHPGLSWRQEHCAVGLTLQGDEDAASAALRADRGVETAGRLGPLAITFNVKTNRRPHTRRTHARKDSAAHHRAGRPAITALTGTAAEDLHVISRSRRSRTRTTSAYCGPRCRRRMEPRAPASIQGRVEPPPKATGHVGGVKKTEGASATTNGRYAMKRTSCGRNQDCRARVFASKDWVGKTISTSP